MLRCARRQARLTQTQLALEAGVTQSVVSAYESGRREPAFSTLSRLLRAAGFDVSLTRRSPSRLRRAVDDHRDELVAALASLGGTNPRLFGSVARGDDTDHSDIDLLVDLAPGSGLLALMRMQAEAERLLGVAVDIVPTDGMKPDVRASSARDAIPL